ncbi:CLUMA_CG016947, isoform A [Clunio marinus]|uniref:CLUMA_CG016947, isoform A n=1 Tax=Clunio marinus TaxID=568069 RepID=A0A1J1ITP3_9DIPT|nr:CLUMA_CG016947, isoform A [Clunio marinus]
MNINYLIIFVVMIINTHTSQATFDFSNVDLVNFQYFKYPKTSTTNKPFFLIERNGRIYGIRRIPDPPNKIQKTIDHAKAVFSYLKGVAIGTSKEKIKSKHVFDPEFGDKKSFAFQAKHGKFGEKLVDLLGSGPSYERLVQSGAIDH